MSFTVTSPPAALSLQLAAASSEDGIHTSMIYSQLPTDGTRPYNYINEPPAGVPRTSLTPIEVPTVVKDLRKLSKDEYGTEISGFGFETEGTKMEYEDWAQEEKIRGVYYPEVEKFLKKQFNAHTIHIFDHTVRRTPPVGTVVKDTPETRQPVSRVHVDQTPESAIARVHRHLPEDADRLLKGRYRLVNVWRPFHTVYDIPLAVVDYRTLDYEKDLVPTALIYPDREGETFTVLHTPNQKFYAPSHQTKDEVILLKCFDSEALKEGSDHIAKLTPHTAFIDHRFYGKEGVRGRESIELRCLVFSDE
ncbi:hypothetical protein BT69DRAFT_1353375 [Atractiella rhizophila]|nr:hypothetical protein BT69DRAFT_1246826 [Atractiella rhizophila]KAH8919102.1 hypothetical protein BT69DRAFT_1353375 [Atractiella rhizophila]